jgi:ribonucleoside-diphosphate reductase alpha chain
MEFIETEAKNASAALGEKKGSFPNFAGSVYPKKGYKTMRNATVTTIAPAGTLSMIADTSSGIEPLYALVFTKHVLDGTELLYVNPFFEEALKKEGIHSRELMRKVARGGGIQDLEEISDGLKKVYVVASDISPRWHVQMQAAFQKNTDNSVSKTINFPGSATIDDVKKAYLLAYKLGCKGLTIYRDTSRAVQVLTRSENFDLDIAPNQVPLPLKIETAPAPQKPKPARKPQEIIPPPVIAKDPKPADED